MNNYIGVIIEESLENNSILKDLHIISTKIEAVTSKHQTPWLKKWTLDTFEVDENEAESTARKLSQALQPKHGWYIDFRNLYFHFVIFKNKVFKINRSTKSDYEEMVKYGLTVGTPSYQLPNFIDLPIDVLDIFLREANTNTYANEKIKKATSLRHGSNDYHFESGDLTFHDTYFGTTKFIGEEIVYKNDVPVWGMNYYGFTLSDEISESLFDAILRPALMSGAGDNIPVRGPKEFVNGDWTYAFDVKGELANFTGLEEISKNGEIVCRLYCHGGFVE